MPRQKTQSTLTLKVCNESDLQSALIVKGEKTGQRVPNMHGKHIDCLTAAINYEDNYVKVLDPATWFNDSVYGSKMICMLSLSSQCIDRYGERPSGVVGVGKKDIKENKQYYDAIGKALCSI